MNPLLLKSIFRNFRINLFSKEQISISLKNVLQKECMFTLSPDKHSLLLFSNQPIQLKTRSTCVLVAGTQRNLFKSLVKVGYSSLLVFHQPRGSSSLSTEGSFLNLPDKNKTMKRIFYKFV